MLGPKHTAVVMWALIAVALAYEALALSFGRNATISEWVWTLSANPLFVFACGFLAGHFWFVKSRCVWCGRNPYRKEL